jgi:hypothetical protein
MSLPENKYEGESERKEQRVDDRDLSAILFEPGRLGLIIRSVYRFAALRGLQTFSREIQKINGEHRRMHGETNARRPSRNTRNNRLYHPFASSRAAFSVSRLWILRSLSL